MNYILEFDQLIRSIRQNTDTVHSILLGAGASIESGVPSANDCIWDWKKDIFLSKNPSLISSYNNIKSDNVKKSIQQWYDNQGIFPELNADDEYSYFAERAYVIEGDRRKYFQHIVEGKTPSLGYHLISLLAESGIIKSVWTTNFDGLMLKTAHQYNIVPIEVTLESEGRVHRVETNNELLCIALHGDYKYGMLMNTSKELDSQNEILIKHLSYETERRNFIVIGYSGRDKSLMSSLEQAYTKKGAGRLYWCGYGREIPANVSKLIEKINSSGREAYYIPTDGFDRTMLNISRLCMQDERKIQARIDTLLVTLSKKNEYSHTKFVPLKDIYNRVLNTNMHPITFAKTCYQFKIKHDINKGFWDYCRELMQYNIIAIPYGRMIYAWGNKDTIAKMCNNSLDSEISITPFTRELLMENSNFKEMLVRALCLILGRKAKLKYNKYKIWDENQSFTFIVNGKKVQAYEAISINLSFDWKNTYITFNPDFTYPKEIKLEREEHKSFSQMFSERINGKKPNLNYYDYIKKWNNKLFNDLTVKESFPYESESEFKFVIGKSSLLIGMQSRNGINIPLTVDRRRVQVTGIELKDSELVFYNPAQQTIVKDFHPMRGLTNNAPYDFSLNNKIFRPQINLGVLCPEESSEKFKTFLENLNKVYDTKYNIDYVIRYPGFYSAYGILLNIPEIRGSLWTNIKLKSAGDLYKDALNFADNITRKIEVVSANQESDVVLIYIPKEYEFLTYYNDESIRFDLHDYVKAFAAQKKVATQFVRECTLESDMECQIAWAISLALYVKSGRTPWVLSGLRKDTAFAGIGYSLNHLKDSEKIIVGCSHIYSSDGQGLKYKLSKINDVTFDEKNNPYLSESEAYNLGLSIKELFFASFSEIPKRVVIHKRTPFQKQEIQGIVNSLSSAGIDDIDLIQITYEDDIKCFEYDKNFEIDGFPIRRGYCFPLNEDTAYLYTHGIAPSIRNPNFKYFQGGKSIPLPLKIVKYYGNGDLSQIASEILGLSKMNWNSFGLYSKLPCTIESSSAIARIGWLLSQYEGNIYDYRYFM